jgi:hypothetical protein
MRTVDVSKNTFVQMANITHGPVDVRLIQASFAGEPAINHKYRTQTESPW